MKRIYKIEILLENDCETAEDGLKMAQKQIESLGIKVNNATQVISRRTERQNNALHLWFTLLSKELQEHGLDMRTVLKDGFDFPATPYAIKEFIWRPTQLKLFGKKSTTKLDKKEEINKIYDVISKALIERTNGMINIPDFPSIDNLLDS